MLIIRQARPQDFATLADIEADAARVFPVEDLPRDQRVVSDFSLYADALSAGWLWVAEMDRAGACGFIACKRFPHCLHILEMDVRRSHAGRGIGKRLLATALTCAQQHALHTTLTTFAHLRWNAPFYAQQGFKLVREPAEFPHLATALADEANRGLKNRVAMLHNATP